MREKNNSEFAGFFVRLFASLIDSIITLPLIFAILHIFGISEFSSFKISGENYSFSQMTEITKSSNINDLISTAILFFYSVFFLISRKQATPGKRIMNIYVATKDNKKLSTLQAAARFFASILSVLLFGIGILMIAFTPEKTALHDLICNTRVRYGKKQ